MQAPASIQTGSSVAREGTRSTYSAELKGCKRCAIVAPMTNTEQISGGVQL